MFSLTTWLAFWLARLCDVDHMEFRGVWCRTALCGVEAVYPCAWGPIRLPGVAARRVTAGCRGGPGADTRVDRGGTAASP